MLRGGNLASAGGPSPPAVTGIARAETLGPDGGQRTWKPGPDAAVGPTGAQESTQDHRTVCWWTAATRGWAGTRTTHSF